MPSNDLNSLDGIIKNDVKNIEASNSVTQFISQELINMSGISGLALLINSFIHCFLHSFVHGYLQSIIFKTVLKRIWLSLNIKTDK